MTKTYDRYLQKESEKWNEAYNADPTIDDYPSDDFKLPWLHRKHGTKYRIVSVCARMKDVKTGEWIDCVVYAPLYENEFEMFARETKSFFKEFEPCYEETNTER